MTFGKRGLTHGQNPAFVAAMLTDTDRDFVREIETFLVETGVPARQFGLAVSGDAKLVADLRRHRSATLRLVDRARAYMTAVRAFQRESRAPTGEPTKRRRATARADINQLPSE